MLARAVVCAVDEDARQQTLAGLADTGIRQFGVRGRLAVGEQLQQALVVGVEVLRQALAQAQQLGPGAVQVGIAQGVQAGCQDARSGYGR